MTPPRSSGLRLSRTLWDVRPSAIGVPSSLTWAQLETSALQGTRRTVSQAHSKKASLLQSYGRVANSSHPFPRSSLQEKLSCSFRKRNAVTTVTFGRAPGGEKILFENGSEGAGLVPDLPGSNILSGYGIFVPLQLGSAGLAEPQLGNLQAPRNTSYQARTWDIQPLKTYDISPKSSLKKLLAAGPQLSQSNLSKISGWRLSLLRSFRKN